jgi:Family of unknown function (DUF6788)
MEPTLESLLEHKKQLYQQLASLGEFRRGSISVNYRKCGKSNCGCAQPGHPGHGPQYLWNATIGGKSQARNLCLGPELEKVGELSALSTMEPSLGRSQRTDLRAAAGGSRS